jgi:hypothetical protein
MKFENYNILEHEIYARENKLTKNFSFYLFCYQIDFYENPKYCLYCFCFTR